MLRIFALLLLTMTIGHAQTVLQLRADIFCPFNCEPDTAQPGYAVEILQEIFAPHGIEIDYKTMPWVRTLREAANGNIDGALGTSEGEEPSLILHTEPLGKPSLALVVREGDNFQYDGITSLFNRRLGAIAGYHYDSGAIDDYIATNARNQDRVHLLRGEEVSKNLIRLLLAGRVDTLIEYDFVFEFNAARMAEGYQAKIAYREPGVDLWVGFTPQRPESPRWAAMVDEGIRELLQSGRLAQILSKYDLNDWQE